MEKFVSEVSVQPLVYSEHAERRMRERGITPEEVDEALANTFLPPPGIPSVKGHVWGTTSRGRRLRITKSMSRENLIVSVVAPVDAHESRVR
jgi:hypothetical protein